MEHAKSRLGWNFNINILLDINYLSPGSDIPVTDNLQLCANLIVNLKNGGSVRALLNSRFYK